MKYYLDFILGPCYNTDAGHIDKNDKECHEYASHNWCGPYADDDFNGFSMCCICGGGTDGK